MASTATYTSTGHNTYQDNQTDGTFRGDAATGQRTRYISRWVKALAPYSTPLMSSISFGSPVNHFLHEWGQSYQLPHRMTLNEALDTTETGVDFQTGEGAYLQQFAVLRILNDASDHGEETVWVQSVAGNTATVVRNADGDYVTGVAHDDDTVVEVIGIAEPQNVDHPRGSIIYGDTNYNYPQRWATSLQYDEFAIHEPNLEFGNGDQLVKQIRRKMLDLKLTFEKALFYGRRAAGLADSTPATDKRPSLMGGLPQYITTNAVDLNGDPLTMYDLNSAITDIWDTAGENMPRVLLMSMATKQIINRMFDAFRGSNVTLEATKASFYFQEVSFEAGDYFLGVSRRCPDGEIYGVDLDMMKIFPYEGQNWQTKELPVSGSYEIKAISGAFTFELAGEAAMFRISGFDTDLSHYTSPWS